MPASKSTPKVRAPSAAVPAAASLNDLPINIINDRLDRAHATLDLLYSIAIDERGEDILETLSTNTLQTAMHDAMRNIDEARDAANREAGT